MVKNDRVYYCVCYTVAFILLLAVLYPILYVISASFSSGSAVTRGDVWLWPVDFSLEGYKAVFKYKNVWIGYRNTIFYTILGTSINLIVTMLCAYPMARKGLRGKKAIMLIFTFTMLFDGGMIPKYILMKNLGLLNTIWAIILPAAMSVYNMIVARTFIESNIPDELLEAAKIDGCNDCTFFFKVVLPLSKAVIAVLALWYAVSHWNSYFRAFLYLTDKNLYPLQIFLRDILVQNEVSAEMIDPEMALQLRNTQQILKYSLIVVSTAPLFCIYPFVQKHFVKGVMVGSVKG